MIETAMERRPSTRRPGKLKKVLRQGASTLVRLTQLGSSSSSMGQGQASQAGGGSRRRGRSRDSARAPPPLNHDLPPLRFHPTAHGANISVQESGHTAKRLESFCKGIVFSDRPVGVAERVCLRLTELSSRWSGVLRVGFTQHPPDRLPLPLPKYACPDLTSRPGYWAKALPERYTERADVLVHYFVAGTGDVHVGVDGEDRGVFFSGVDTRKPLWALIDLYGNCTGIQLVDLRTGLNNYSGEAQPSRPSSRQQQQLLQTQHQPPPYPLTSQALASELSQMNIRPAGATASAQPPSSSNYLPLQHNRHVAFRPLSFHPSAGRHVILNESNTLASRHADEFAQGYVFSAAPVRLGERMVVQVLATEESFIGSLAFGLTNADPALIDTESLPEDSDLLLDRPEYWVVSKDVASSPGVGDELSFTVRRDGQVEFSRNGQTPPSTFMHVDASLRLWAFWDIYGHTARVRLLGGASERVVAAPAAAADPPPPQQLIPLPAPTSSHPSQQPVPLPPTSNQPHPTYVPNEDIPSSLGECTVCYENPVDCAIYTCGHMCMCHGCAMQQWKGRGGGFCPICREEIRDIIRTFRA